VKYINRFKVSLSIGQLCCVGAS